MSGIAAIILAAGRSSRMGERYKLLERFDGQSMIAHVATAAVASRARPVVAVTGHRHQEVGAELARFPITQVHNPDFGSGMGSSLARGIGALPFDRTGALVLLGDMPFITTAVIDRLIDQAMLSGPGALIVPVHEGHRGNPVVIGHDWFDAVLQLAGDSGARHLFAAHPERVVEVEIDSPVIFLDIDTPDALAKLTASGSISMMKSR